MNCIRHASYIMLMDVVWYIDVSVPTCLCVYMPSMLCLQRCKLKPILVVLAMRAMTMF